MMTMMNMRIMFKMMLILFHLLWYCLSQSLGHKQLYKEEMRKRYQSQNQSLYDQCIKKSFANFAPDRPYINEYIT